MKIKSILTIIFLCFSSFCLASKPGLECKESLGSDGTFSDAERPTSISDKLNALQVGQAIAWTFKSKERLALQGRVRSVDSSSVLIEGVDFNGVGTRWRFQKAELLEEIQTWGTPRSLPLDAIVKSIKGDAALRSRQKPDWVSSGKSPNKLRIGLNFKDILNVFERKRKALLTVRQAQEVSAIGLQAEGQASLPTTIQGNIDAQAQASLLAARQEEKKLLQAARQRTLEEARRKREAESILNMGDLPLTQAVTAVVPGTEEVLMMACKRAESNVGSGGYRRFESFVVTNNLLPGQMASLRFSDHEASLEGEVIDIAPLVLKVEVTKGDRKVWGLVYLNSNFIVSAKATGASVSELVAKQKIKWRFKEPIQGWSGVEGRILSVGETILVEGLDPQGIPSRLRITRDQLVLVMSVL